jgi:hypothetical protein
LGYWNQRKELWADALQKQLKGIDLEIRAKQKQGDN